MIREVNNGRRDDVKYRIVGHEDYALLEVLIHRPPYKDKAKRIDSSNPTSLN